MDGGEEQIIKIRTGHTTAISAHKPSRSTIGGLSDLQQVGRMAIGQTMGISACATLVIVQTIPPITRGRKANLSMA